MRDDHIPRVADQAGSAAALGMMLLRMLRLRRAGVSLSWIELLSMRLRGALTPALTEALIMNHQAHLGLDPMMIEAHSLAGGGIADVVTSIAAVRAAGLEARFNDFAAHDLAGGFVVSAAELFVTLQRRHPSLTFGEVSGRLLSGEDLARAARRGTFAPRS